MSCRLVVPSVPSSGTGKTFIGVLLAQIILASTNEIILCVCFTNHALDDFLEGLLDAGIRDIVRIGGKNSNERLAEFNLREKAKAGKEPFSREQNRRYAYHWDKFPPYYHLH